jgi:hypothetical protein
MGILYGTSGCVLVLPRTVSRLSELQIDADKDWQRWGIFNLKELSQGMNRGDLVLCDGISLVRLRAEGDIGDELTSERPLPRWKAPPRG